MGSDEVLRKADGSSSKLDLVRRDSGAEPQDPVGRPVKVKKADYSLRDGKQQPRPWGRREPNLFRELGDFLNLGCASAGTHRHDTVVGMMMTVIR